ncbi:hypothetical protein ACFPJ1_05890 [Kribbella qitaiheensis]|uniref:hypothetical protein n=1 Tax=Kribbella qitaiheensis TaxID=1544730 RepID=UPI00361C936A
MNILTVEPQSPPRPTPEEKDKIAYLRSYLLMRAVIGFIGIILPVVLLLGDIFVLKGDVLPRGSLSAYYHSGMRDFFVGSLCVTGLFLITYRVFERITDNLLSVIAGIAALGVAMFPTGRPAGNGILMTPLQEKLGEQTVAGIHFACAAIFIVSLAITSYSFGVREGNRPRIRNGQPAKGSPEFWRRFHWSCAAIIVLALIFIVVTMLTDWLRDYSLIIGEAVAVFAFGASWLTKGLELDFFRQPPPADLPALAEEAAAS